MPPHPYTKTRPVHKAGNKTLNKSVPRADSLLPKQGRCLDPPHRRASSYGTGQRKLQFLLTSLHLVLVFTWGKCEEPPVAHS